MTMSFFEVLFIIVVSFWLLGYVSKHILPWLAKKYTERLMQRFGYSQPRPEKERPEGTITVTSDPQQKRKGSFSNMGEDINFEEVKIEKSKE